MRVSLCLSTLVRDAAVAHWGFASVRRCWSVAALGIFFCTLLLVSYSLYVYFTPYMSPTVKGVQGRYFLPVLPLLLLPFVLRWAEQGIAELKGWVLGLSTISLLAMCVTVYAWVY